MDYHKGAVPQPLPVLTGLQFHLLVGGLVAIFYFPHILGIIIPIDVHIFSKG